MRTFSHTICFFLFSFVAVFFIQTARRIDLINRYACIVKCNVYARKIVMCNLKNLYASATYTTWCHTFSTIARFYVVLSFSFCCLFTWSVVMVIFVMILVAPILLNTFSKCELFFIYCVDTVKGHLKYLFRFSSLLIHPFSQT